MSVFQAFGWVRGGMGWGEVGVSIMSHSFTPSERARVWESSRPFTGSITILFDGLHWAHRRKT